MLRQAVHYVANRLNLVRGDLHRGDRAGALHRAWGHVFTNHMTGDYVEFGVYRGASFVESYRQYRQFRVWLDGQLVSGEQWRREVAARYHKTSVHFHGLDTFAGMPDNAEGNATFSSGTFLSSLPEVKARCAGGGMTDGNYTLYQGLFRETREELERKLTRIAILNIDSDLYESARDALEIAAPFLQVGSVILFDDYNAFNADNRQGERRAFREFCTQSRFAFEPWFSYMYSGQAFLCTGD